MAGRFVEPQLRVGDRQPEQVGLGGGDVDEPLPQLVVAEPLDAPAHALVAVGRLAVGGTEHHDRRPPPTVERILGHRPLGGGAVGQREHDLESLPLVEALLLADPDHRPRVRAVGATAERHLVHDRGSVDEPPDGTDIGPRECGVVEDRRVLLATGVQAVEQLAAWRAEGLGGSVEVEPVTGLVLHLGGQDRLASQRRRPREPVALGLHADDLGVGVLGDLAHERRSVLVRHPVGRLDPLVAVDQRVESHLLIHESTV